MFQFLRRVSGSFLPRPDRPWRDDATSHAPTIGRKRRHSVTELDTDGSTLSAAKRTKNDPVTPDNERDSRSREESPEEDAPPPVETRDVNAVTKGVKRVDLEDKQVPERASSIQPEGIPLPESPSASPESESELRDSESSQVEECENEDDRDSLASSRPEYGAEEDAEAEPVTNDTNTKLADEVAPAQELTAAVESGLYDAPESLDIRA